MWIIRRTWVLPQGIAVTRYWDGTNWVENKALAYWYPDEYTAKEIAKVVGGNAIRLKN